MLFLKGRELRLWKAPIGDVPAESSQFHDHDHLCSGDVDTVGIMSHANQVADGHVAHKKYKSDPGHIGGVDKGNNISAGGTYRQREKTIPKVKEANKIKQGASGKMS